jgi:hypothetical protein
MARHRLLADLNTDPRLQPLLAGVYRSGIRTFVRRDESGTFKRYAARETVARELGCCNQVATRLLAQCPARPPTPVAIRPEKVKPAVPPPAEVQEAPAQPKRRGRKARAVPQNAIKQTDELDELGRWLPASRGRAYGTRAKGQASDKIRGGKHEQRLVRTAYSWERLSCVEVQSGVSCLAARI